MNRKVRTGQGPTSTDPPVTLVSVRFSRVTPALAPVHHPLPRDNRSQTIFFTLPLQKLVISPCLICCRGLGSSPVFVLEGSPQSPLLPGPDGQCGGVRQAQEKRSGANTITRVRAGTAGQPTLSGFVRLHTEADEILDRRTCAGKNTDTLGLACEKPPKRAQTHPRHQKSCAQASLPHRDGLSTHVSELMFSLLGHNVLSPPIRPRATRRCFDPSSENVA